MHYLGVFYNNALSQKILFKQEKKNVRALSQYSFFEQPYAKYQATDTVLAKLDAIKKKCHS